MNRFIEYFYSCSRLTRFLMTSLMLLALCLIPVSISIYNYVNALSKAVKEPQGKLELTTPFYFNETLRSEGALQQFWEACTELDRIATGPWTQGRAFSLAAFSPEMRQTIASQVAVMANTGNEQLLQFCVKSASQDTGMHLRLYRSRLRFLASYTLALVQEQPSHDCLPTVRAMENNSILTELSSPILISKMVAVAGRRLTDALIHQLIRENRVSADTAKTLNRLLQTRHEVSLDFVEVMQYEFRYFERHYLSIYRQAPLGSWLIEQVWGDPVRQYQEYLRNIATLTPQDIFPGKSVLSTHILLQIVIPNFSKARDHIGIGEALRRITLMELATVEGRVEELNDPFTRSPMLRKIVNGRPTLYSTGPNRQNDDMGGDDVYFKDPVTP
jgi:hypothetical protein